MDVFDSRLLTAGCASPFLLHVRSKLVDTEAQPSRSEVMRMTMEICAPLVRGPDTRMQPQPNFHGIAAIVVCLNHLPYRCNQSFRNICILLIWFTAI